MDLGVTDEDMRTLNKKRMLRRALYASAPVVSFFLGYLVKMLIDSQGADEQLASTYPYAVAMASSAPLLSGSRFRMPGGGLTFVGILTISILTFLLGTVVRTAAYPMEDVGPIKYGVFRR